MSTENYQEAKKKQIELLGCQWIKKLGSTGWGRLFIYDKKIKLILWNLRVKGWKNRVHYYQKGWNSKFANIRNWNKGSKIVNQSQTTIKKSKNIEQDTQNTRKSKIFIYKRIVESILKYEAEVWTMNVAKESKLLTTYMNARHKSMRKSKLGPQKWLLQTRYECSRN